jgi:site-specific DNA-methyltransferase (adenine-specific)
MDTQTQKIMFSSKSDLWGTPQNLFNKLNRKYKFTLDPCATAENRKCEKYYTIEQNGLTKAWKDEVVFVNPPYSNIGEWVAKAHYESTHNGATVVMLIPARTDTRYWHDYVMDAANKIYFIKGRLKFADPTNTVKNAAPFPSAVVVFDMGHFRWAGGPTVATMER